MLSPDYEQLNVALADAAVELDAAEAHGILCGMLCAGGTENAQSWIAELITDVAPAQGVAAVSDAVFRAVYAATRAHLESADFTLQPLLPPDSEAVAERAEALGRWCQGMLVGLGLAGVVNNGRLAPPTREALHDLSEISRAGTYAASGTEEDERALFELLEFARMSAYLLHAELGRRNPE